MPAIFRFGLKNLLNGYLSATQVLYAGYVIAEPLVNIKQFKITYFLCDDFAIDNRFLLDDYLAKAIK